MMKMSSIYKKKFALQNIIIRLNYIWKYIEDRTGCKWNFDNEIMFLREMLVC